ncbi:MAG: coproporphyrinogen III oxidase [Hamadaea sp.]|uniref:radical SAM family heme chaperone HemW n=1 Tax=Hamadaea sp. TaxID=2024425 RepID=UPI00181B4903|nr:radical SAM family heme chaperone HemW [Hamadaea sp.]NUR70664.1 coproporphyrinogen III oxidase [Hamadaea sp.]NUT17851.1 coproporphyrinogen III oxidase [Hamadaea sp.]
MPATLPDGEPVPTSGELPASALDGVGERDFGVYLHVPFCASRCGYCDFNTYTPTESGLAQGDYVSAALAEIELARRVLPEAGPVRTVFVGGGTPTLLPPDDLARLLDAVDQAWGLAPGAEVTTEANPESVDPASLARLRKAGFTRISLGMQSAAAHVLRVLDRRHTPGRATAAAAEAREAGLEHVNLDLIYGTPGETAADFEASLQAAVTAGVDHVSAYSLIVEDGTRLAARIRRGEVPMPSDDVAADRYLAAEAVLSGAGLGWYEVSNWAASEGARCAHNLLYWTGGDWWGIGPGAHSHVGGVRWWNVKRPAHYAKLLADGHSPGAGRERLSDEDRYVEDVMLRLRLRDGYPLAQLRDDGPLAAERARADGLLDDAEYADGRAVLTLRGRLLADAVIRDLLT